MACRLISAHFHYFHDNGFFRKVAIAATAGICIHLVVKVCKKVARNKRRKNYKRDVVILHQYWRSRLAPNVSPFCLKLETFLRMAKIPYEVDNIEIIGPKGKSPWITLNGEDISDSTLIIEYLNKKYSLDFQANVSAETRAINRLVTIALEEHFFWCFEMYIFIFDQNKTLLNLMELPIFVRLFIPLIKRKTLKTCYYQGIARHSEREIIEMGKNDLRAVSTVLGNKPYFGGEKPSEVDCAMFGMLAQLLWHFPLTPFGQLVTGELSNLKAFCLKMKEEFYPDWNELLQKK